MDKTVEIRELDLVIILCIVFNVVKLGAIKDLHSNYAKDIEEKGKDIKKFDDDWHDFYKSRK